MTLDWTAQKALRQARFTMLTCAYVAPALYGGAISMEILRGHWIRFFQSPGRIPWSEPRTLVLTGLALAALAGALTLPGRIRSERSPLGALRTRALLASLLLLAVALCGLYTGMKLGSAAAPLALAMLAAPPAAGLLLFPTTRRWGG